MADSAQFFGRGARPRVVAAGRVEAEVFRTITGADWAREIARARGTPNAVTEQIRRKLAEGRP